MNPKTEPYSPELKSWLCGKCRTYQKPLDQRYGHIYCHKCATQMAMESYGFFNSRKEVAAV